MCNSVVGGRLGNQNYRSQDSFAANRKFPPPKERQYYRNSTALDKFKRHFSAKFANSSSFFFLYDQMWCDQSQSTQLAAERLSSYKKKTNNKIKHVQVLGVQI